MFSKSGSSDPLSICKSIHKAAASNWKLPSDFQPGLDDDLAAHASPSRVRVCSDAALRPVRLDPVIMQPS